MIAKEGLPALRWWPPSLCHVFCNGRLADNDAQLEQLAVNPWRSPQRVGNAHLANELADVHGRPWPAAARPSTLPASTTRRPADQTCLHSTTPRTFVPGMPLAAYAWIK